jgi:hypothetical protein
LMLDWWNEISLNSKRDQISLPYVLWRHGVKPLTPGFNYSRNNPYFRVRKHRYNVKRSGKQIMLVKKPLVARIANRMTDITCRLVSG